MAISQAVKRKVNKAVQLGNIASKTRYKRTTGEIKHNLKLIIVRG